MRVAASLVGQTEESRPEASLVDVAMEQASASMSPAPSTTGGAALEELWPQKGSAPLGIGVEPSRSLVWVVALDNTVEEREWESVHMEVGDAVHALTTMLSSMCNIVSSVSQV